MATIASLPYCEHGDHDEDVFPCGQVTRSPAAARQLASRARRRVRGADVHAPDRDITRQREVVDAFFAAAHNGDFGALVAILDPDVVVRVDGGTARPEASVVLRGAAAVAGRTFTIAQPSVPKLPVLVNGAAGVIAMVGGQPSHLRPALRLACPGRSSASKDAELLVRHEVARGGIGQHDATQGRNG